MSCLPVGAHERGLVLRTAEPLRHCRDPGEAGGHGRRPRGRAAPGTARTCVSPSSPPAAEHRAQSWPGRFSLSPPRPSVLQVTSSAVLISVLPFSLLCPRLFSPHVCLDSRLLWILLSLLCSHPCPPPVPPLLGPAASHAFFFPVPLSFSSFPVHQSNLPCLKREKRKKKIKTQKSQNKNKS